MGGMFGSPSLPSPAPPPPPPKKSAEEVRAEEQKVRRRAAAATGRQSTILTGGQGVEPTATQRKALLGE